MKQLWRLIQQWWPSLLFLVTAGALVWLIGIDLWADYRQRHAQFEPARDARIVEARCRVGLVIAAFCNVRAAGASLPGGGVELRYFLLDWTGDNTPIALLRAKGPEAPTLRHITTTYGLEHLTARIASFAVLELVTLSFVLAPLVGFLRRRRM